MPDLQQTTFTLEDLRARAGSDGPIPPEMRLAVLGFPVEHSLSPAMQNAALEAAGSDIRYGKILCPAENLAEAVGFARQAGFLGLNLTIPHKFEALQLCTELDDTARQLGAVNTLLFDGSRTAGFNTDGPGLVRAIRDVFSFDLRDLRVMILGAGGGAGSAAALQCALEKCPRLVLVNRTEDKARDVARRAAALLHTDRLEGPENRVTVIPLENAALGEQLARTDLVVNASSLGMKRTDPRLVPAALITPDLMVFDMIYRPAVTRLLEDAQAAGARTANGLSMLLHQGALSLEIWLNRPAPLDAMRAALQQAAAAF
ncbi:MAG: shikimate dehydrogenase [Chthoniobacterales bacterium]|nr:shikimate dehydrogenase [Chthoniobacterales bacterium]